MQHRKAHGIESPKFMQPESNSSGLGSLSISEIKPKIERSLNPEHFRESLNLQRLNEKKNLLENEKNALLQRLAQIANQDPGLMAFVQGATVSAGITYLASEKDKSGNAIAGALAGGFLWAFLGGVSSQSETKQKRMNEIKAEIDRLTAEINGTSISVFFKELELKGIPKTIEKPAIEAPQTSLPLLLEDLLKSKTNAAEPLKMPINSNEKEGTVLNAKEFSKKIFNTIPFKGIWAEFIGTPEFGFSLSIYGKPGQGKSTFALSFAKYLAENHGKVVFNSSEERHSKTLQDKLLRLEATSDMILITSCTTIEDLTKQINNRPSPFVIIDSIDNMKATPEGIEKLKNLFSKTSFILIHQSTKDGKQRGSNEFTHNSDIVVKIENGQAITDKNRYAPAGRQLDVVFQTA